MSRRRSAMAVPVILLFSSFLFRGEALFGLPTSFLGIRVDMLLSLGSTILAFVMGRLRTTRTSVFYLLAAMSILAVSYITTLRGSAEYAAYVLVYAALGLVVGRYVEADRNLLRATVALFLLVFELLALYEIATGSLAFHPKPPYDFGVWNIRSYLMFSNPNNASMFLVLLLLLLNLLRGRRSPLMAWHYGAVLAICLINASRMSVGVVMLTMLLFDRRLLAGFLLVAVALVLLSPRLRALLTVTGFSGGSLGNGLRTQLVRDAISSLAENPLGIGIGQSDLAFQTNLHSFVLQLTTELGLLGVLIWLVYYLLVTCFVRRLTLAGLLILAGLPLYTSQISRLMSDPPIVTTMLVIASVILAGVPRRSRSEALAVGVAVSGGTAAQES